MRERITGEIAVFDKQGDWSIDRITPNRLKCTIEAKIEVACHARDVSFAPLFADSVTLNKRNFIEGNPLKIEVESENNLYFYLFCYFWFCFDWSVFVGLFLLIEVELLIFLAL